MKDCGTGRLVYAFAAGVVAAVGVAFAALCVAEWRWYR